MIPSAYFIFMISITVLSLNTLNNFIFSQKRKEFISGMVLGFLMILAMYLHFYAVEPFAVFPRINTLITNFYFISISFFLFGLKAGLITLMIGLMGRLFLTEVYLFYSVLLFLFSSIIGFFFNLLVQKNNFKLNNFPIVLLLSISNGIISLLIFFLNPYKDFVTKLYPNLIYIIIIIPFLIFLITILISKNRIQKSLLSELKYKDALLTATFHNLGEAIIVTDEKLNILQMNLIAQKITGFHSDEFENKNLFDVFRVKQKETIDKIKDQLLLNEDQSIIHYDNLTIISKSGEEISIECKFTFAFEKYINQKINFLVFKDVSEIKKTLKLLEDSEKKFRYLFDFSLEGIWLYNLKEPVSIHLPPEEQIKLFFEHCYLADCNDVFAKMYGFDSKNEIIGSPLSANLIPEDENNIAYLTKFIESNYRLANAESIEKDKAGKIKYFLNSLYGIIENDHIVGAWGFQIDVTEEKLISKQIRDNNKLLLSILNAPKGIIVFALDKNYCYTAFSVSHKEIMKNIWGVDIKIGMNMLDAIKSENDRIKAKNNFDKALNGQYLNLVEEYGDEKLRRQFWIDNYSPIYDGNEIIGVAVYVTDISQQKEFEKELEEKNLLLNTLLNNLPDSVYVKDKSLRKILTNKTDLKWMGYDDEKQVLGKRDDEIYGEEFAKISLEDDKKAINGIPVINREEKIITKDGKEIYILTTKIPLYDNDNNLIGLVGIGRDITENKIYLKKLEQSEQKLKVLFNEAFQLIGLLNSDGILLEANQTACDFAGVKIEEVINKPFVETPWWAHSKAEQIKLRDAFRRALEGNFVRMDTNHLNKKNELRIIDFSLTPIKNSSGAVEFLIAEGRDITELAAIKQKLTESEEKYKLLIEASMDAILVVNSEGVILLSNKKQKSLFDSLPSDLDKHNFLNLIHKEDVEKFKFEIKLILSGKTGSIITLRFRKKDSEFFWGDLSINQFIDSEGITLFICILRDITYKKQIEDELKKRVYELENINRLMVGRELKMIELKKEVNSLCKQLGLSPRYSNDE